MMNKQNAFKTWLLEQGKNPRVAKDMGSRVSRVEAEFQKTQPEFSLIGEYSKDKGTALMDMLLSAGRNLPDENTLPRGRSAYPIANAVQWYFKYIESKEI